MPQFPAKAISSSVVTRPPSERSWPARISSSETSCCTALNALARSWGSSRSGDVSPTWPKTCASAEPPSRFLPDAEIDEQKFAFPRRFEIRGHGLGDVRAGDVGGDHECTGRFHGLVRTVGICNFGGHGQAVLAAVHCHAELDHHVAHGNGGIIEPRAFAGKLRRPHPVCGTADIAEPAYPGPDDVRERFAYAHPGHGSGIDQFLYGLFADGDRGAGQAEVGLGDHRDVGHR